MFSFAGGGATNSASTNYATLDVSPTTWGNGGIHIGDVGTGDVN